MNNNYTIKHSKIHGFGVFSTKEFKRGHVIGKLVTLKNIYSPIVSDDLGKWINHAWIPNCIMYKSKSKDAYYLVALHRIEPNSELTLNYNDCPLFIVRADSSWK